MHESVQRMWHGYLTMIGRKSDFGSDELISAWHFCDNEADADLCADLVLLGVKRATAPSLWELEDSGLAMPAAGDLHVVTNWAGVAQCVIRTTAVEVLPFTEVTDEHAALEGEGDGSLGYWRRTHREYYQRVLRDTGRDISDDMPVVFERFEVVYPVRDESQEATGALRAPSADVAKSSERGRRSRGRGD